MGVYIDGLDIPKPIKGIKTCYDILITSDGSVEEFDSDDRNEYKAEEIYLVRCGECKWWDKDGKRKDGKGWCENVICGLTEPNAFCAYGERRADE